MWEQGAGSREQGPTHRLENKKPEPPSSSLPIVTSQECGAFYRGGEEGQHILRNDNSAGHRVAPMGNAARGPSLTAQLHTVSKNTKDRSLTHTLQGSTGVSPLGPCLQGPDEDSHHPQRLQPETPRLLTGQTVPKSSTCDEATHGHAGKGLHIQGMPGLSESRKANMKQMGLSRSYKLPKGTPAVQQWVGTFQKSIPMRAGQKRLSW